MFKKSMVAFLSTLFLVVFTACGASEEGATDGGKSPEEIFELTAEANESLESAEISMTLDQEMSMPGEEAFNTKSDMIIQSTFDPLTMHQKGKMKMEGEGFPEDEAMDIEMYMTEDGFYLYEGMSGQWIKGDSEFNELMDLLGAEQPDPNEQLEMLEEYISDFNFEETEDAYVFTLDMDGDSFHELMNELLDDMLDPELAAMFQEEEIMESMEIEKLSYDISFDKETYYIKTYDIEMDMVMNIEGMEMGLKQFVETEYSKFNEIDPIEVPEDVVEEAIEDGF